MFLILSLFHSCLFLIWAIEARCEVEHEDVVGAAPIGDAPTTSEWSSNLLPTKVWLIRGLKVCDPLMIIWPHLKVLAHILSVIF